MEYGRGSSNVFTAILRILSFTPSRAASRPPFFCHAWNTPLPTVPPPIMRSEEHTSELQSRAIT
jgi:hypothetical protein